jgi:hypothetical protein
MIMEMKIATMTLQKTHNEKHGDQALMETR